MKFANESELDRAVRMLAGIALLFAALGGYVTGAVGSGVLVAGALALGTGIVGYCPAYTLLGLSTRKIKAAGCPHCDPPHDR